MVKQVTIKNIVATIDFGCSWKISTGGYFHFMFFTLGFGQNGMGIYFLNFYFGISLNKLK